jgi:hypothetical protein
MSANGKLRRLESEAWLEWFKNLSNYLVVGNSEG